MLTYGSRLDCTGPSHLAPNAQLNIEIAFHMRSITKFHLPMNLAIQHLELERNLYAPSRYEKKLALPITPVEDAP